MRTYLALFAAILATSAHAKVPRLNSTDACVYVASLEVVMYTPRRVAPRFYKVSPETFADMEGATRKSVLNPRYDAIWQKTDMATNRIFFAMQVRAECKAFQSAQEALRVLLGRLAMAWELIRRSPASAATCSVLLKTR